MSARRTAAAFLCLLVLGGLVWIDSLHVETGLMTEQAERTLLGMGLDEIEAFTLENQHGRFVLARRPDGWWLTEPIEALADQTWLSIILSNLVNAKRASLQENVRDERLGDYGLDAPQATAAFRAADGREITIAVGDEAQGVPRHFATEVGAGEVFTVGAQVAGNLDKTLLQLRDRRVFADLEPTTVTTIVVTAEGTVTRIEGDEQGRWWIVGEDSSATADRRKADIELVASLILSTAGLQATDFPEEEDPQARGLVPPAASLALIAEDGSAHRIDVGDPVDIGGENFFAQAPGRPEVITIAGRVRGMIPRRAVDWIDRDLMRLSPEEVGRISLSAPRVEAAEEDFHQRFERDEDGHWRSATSPDELVNEETMESLLRLFARLSADRVETLSADSLADFGLARPLLSFVWHSRDGSVTEHLDLGGLIAPGEPTAFYRRGQEEVIFTGPTCYESAMALGLDLIDRRLVTADLSQARRIVYTRGDLTFDIRSLGGIWTLVGPGEEPLVELSRRRIESALTILINAVYLDIITGDTAEAVRTGLVRAPWSVTVHGAAGETLADLRASAIPHGAEPGERLIILLDGQRACWVQRSTLTSVQDWLDQMVRGPLGTGGQGGGAP
jgi:hypothetical protein